MLAAEYFRMRCQAVEAVCNMIEQLEMMLEFEAPTVSEMLRQIKRQSLRLPKFIFALSDGSDAQAAVESIRKMGDEYDECDRLRLEELFMQLGSADKECERQRLASAHAYFSQRLKQLRQETQRRCRLAKNLGLLGGAFLAVILI